MRDVPDDGAAERVGELHRGGADTRARRRARARSRHVATVGLGDHRVVRGHEDLGHAAGGDEVERRRGRGRTERPGTVSNSACPPPPAMPKTRLPTAGSVTPGRARRPRPRTRGRGCRRATRAARVAARALREVGAVEAGAVHAYQHLARARAPDRRARRPRGRPSTIVSARMRRRLPPPAHPLEREALRCAHGRAGARGARRRRRGRRPRRRRAGGAPRDQRRARSCDGVGVPAVPEPDRRGGRARRPPPRCCHRSAASGALLELADDAPTLHLYVRDLDTNCRHRAWRDPGHDEWSDAMSDLVDRPGPR